MTATATSAAPRGAGRRGALNAGQALLTAWIVLFALATLWWMFDRHAVLFVLGVLACTVVTVPLTRRGYSLLSPWTMVVLIVYVGGGLRGLAIASGFDTTTRSLDELFLLGHGPEYFLGPGAVYVTALALMTGTFLLASRSSLARASLSARGDETGFFARYRIHRNVLTAAVPLALLGLSAFVIQIRRAGGFDLSRLSTKNSVVENLTLIEGSASDGDLLLLNSLSAVAFWVVVAHYSASGRRLGPVNLRGWILGAFALNAIAMPIYNSSRTDALFILLVGLGVSLMVRRQVPVRTIVTSGLTLLLLLSVMTLLRASGAQNTAEISLRSIGDSTANALVYNRNFGDIPTASHVIHTVPEAIPYQNGDTILVWAVAPIPRSIWADKPIVNVGPLIGYHVYGNVRSGVPPGLVGDLYLNFGYWGILAGVVLVGWMLGKIDSWRQGQQDTANPAFALLYVPLAIDFTKNVMNRGIGAAMFNSAMLLLVVGLCLWWVGTTRQQSPSETPKGMTSVRSV